MSFCNQKLIFLTISSVLVEHLRLLAWMWDVIVYMHVDDIYTHVGQCVGSQRCS